MRFYALKVKRIWQKVLMVFFVTFVLFEPFDVNCMYVFMVLLKSV